MESSEKIALSVAEAAEVLGVSTPTVYKLIRRSDFPSFKVGTRTLVSRTKLEKWVEAQAEGGM